MRKLLLLAVLFTAFAAHAQQLSVAGPSGALSACPTPVASTTAPVNILCSVTDGWYVSINGAAYVKINQVTSPVVGGTCPSSTPMVTGITPGTGAPVCAAVPVSPTPSSISCSSVIATLTTAGNSAKLSGCQ